ncbi:Protein SIP5 [Pseudozyma hubeiensis]|nr:Protein SIP5 [Pseudozyma hubeiensis]
MGQQQTKESGAAGSSAQHSSHTRNSSRGITPSASANLVASLSAASLRPPSPPPLPAHLADSVRVDQGGLIPQGVYTGPKDYDQHFVRQNIVDRRLAPFCKGTDDEDELADSKFNSECPICFLNYPTPLNFSRCCHQPICTECFVQMKRADPNSHNPPSSEPRSCPFCVEPEFGVTYTPPEELEHARRSSGSGSDSPNDAIDAANFAEMAIGTGGAGVSGASSKKKILAADDPSVITVDQIRPDWHLKLAQAEAAVARRANRRVIMRQVGDRLIPIGISSSRMGADLAAAAESGRINLNGPGGSIILNDGQNWPGAGSVATTRRRSSRPSRGAADGVPELARLMRMGNGEDMEEAMIMEAMRLSLLEHEEQQRKQAEEEKRKKAAADAQTAAATSSSGSASRLSTSNDLTADTSATIRPPVGAAQSVLEESEGAGLASSPAAPALPLPRPPVSNVDPASLGLSQTTMDELRELIDAGPSPPHSSSSAPSPSGAASSSAPVESSASARPLRSIPAPEPVPVPQPIAGLGSALSEQHGYPSPPPEIGPGTAKQHATVTTTTHFDTDASAPASPGSSGFAAAPTAVPRSRIINPNNPFRRSMGESHH